VSEPRRVLLLGAGYLARFVTAALPAATPLIEVRRRVPPARPPARSGRVRVAADVTTADGVSRIARQLETGAGETDVLFMLPPSGLGEHAPADALGPLLGVLGRHGVRRVAVVSSSGIYAEEQGGEVTAATPVDADNPRARRLAAIEQAWIDSGLAVSVVRLAGIYGPGRIIGRDGVLAGRSLPGAPTAWLNLIRAEDAARALLAALDAPRRVPVALIADGNPMRRGDYYALLASLLGAPAPRFGEARPARGGSKRCNPAASWRALGLAPLWPDWRASLAALLAEDAGGAR